MSTNTIDRRLSFFATLLPILFVASWLRLAALHDPVWLDELHTSWCVSASFWEVGPRAMEGNQTPLYFWLVWPVYQGLGETGFGLRLVSLVASLLLVASIGWIVFRWSGSLAGTALAAGLAAIDDKFLFYAVEARPYVLVQLAAVWQVALLGRLLIPGHDYSGRGTGKVSRAHAACFWLLTNVLVWLHPTTVLLLCVESVIFLGLAFLRAWRSRTPIWKIRYSLIPFFGLLALIIPGIYLLVLVNRRALWESIVEPSPFLLLTIADWLICIAIPLLAVLVFARQHPLRWHWPGLTLSVIFLSAFVALLATWLHWAPLADYRYTVAAAAMIPIVAGSLTGLIKLNMNRLAVVATVIVLALSTNPLLPGFVRIGRLPAQRVEHWEPIVEQINSDGLPVCFYPNLVEDPWLEELAIHRFDNRPQIEYFQFALRGIYPVFGLQRVEGRVETLSMISPQSPSLSMMNRFQDSGGGWILVRARQSDVLRVLNKIPEWFGSKWQIDYEDFSLPPLYLFRIKLVEVE